MTTTTLPLKHQFIDWVKQSKWFSTLSHQSRFCANTLFDKLYILSVSETQFSVRYDISNGIFLVCKYSFDLSNDSFEFLITEFSTDKRLLLFTNNETETSILISLLGNCIPPIHISTVYYIIFAPIPFLERYSPPSQLCKFIQPRDLIDRA